MNILKRIKISEIMHINAFERVYNDKLKDFLKISS